MNVMLKESLKQEIDMLNDYQLWRISEFVESLKSHAQQLAKHVLFWQRVTPNERAQEFRVWVSGLQPAAVSLPDEAFDRESIYE
ncbi:MAG: hypothetical protein AAF639_12650 [Chloroflexota bacterium]